MPRNLCHYAQGLLMRAGTFWINRANRHRTKSCHTSISHASSCHNRPSRTSSCHNRPSRTNSCHNSTVKQSKPQTLAWALIAAVTLAGCSSTKVTRVDANKEIALTDKWNDEDSRQVSTEMIQDMLSFPWTRDFQSQNPGKRPAIIVLNVRNKSHEHIAVDTFTNDIKRAIIRSGQASFVADSDERTDLRTERKDQELNSRDAKRQAFEKAADYALSGSINSIVDQVDGDRVTFYQVDLKLVDMESNIEVWNGQKKLKKFSERSTFGW